MAGKMFLSVLYNIIIFICLYLVYWSYSHTRYDFLVAAVIVAGVFVVLKLSLLKQVRAMEDPRKK